MDVIDRLRDARQHAGLTQHDLASLLGTTQSAIARLEAHRVAPRLETVEAYASAVGHRLEVHGPDVTAACVRGIAHALDGHGGADAAMRSVIQLFDDLLTTPDPAVALATEPATTGSPQWDAAVAAACERAARLRGIEVPGWTAAPSRFLRRWWAPIEDVLGRPAPGLVCLALASSPPEFAVRGVLIDRDTLASV